MEIELKLIDSRVNDMKATIQEFEENISRTLEAEKNKLTGQAEEEAKKIISNAKAEAEKFVIQARQESENESSMFLRKIQKKAEQIQKISHKQAAIKANEKSAQIMSKTQERATQIVKEVIESSITQTKSELLQSTDDARNKLKSKTFQLFTIIKNIENIISKTHINLETGIDHSVNILTKIEDKVPLLNNKSDEENTNGIQHGSNADTKIEAIEKSKDVDTSINQPKITEEITENHYIGLHENQSITIHLPQVIKETVTGSALKTEEPETTVYWKQLSEKPETKSAEILKIHNPNQAVREESNVIAGDVRKSEKPGYIELWLQDGISLLETGKIHEALGVLKKVTKNDPENTLAWEKLGMAFSMQGRNLEALNALRKAINLSPNDIDAWHNIGIIYSKLGQKEEAKKAKEMEKQLIKQYLDRQIESKRNRLIEQM
jgi:tetratricopeptide (TPR) repeat protein